MKTKLLDTKEAATTKHYAAMDASMRNIANKSSYTEAVRHRIESMKMVLDTVYKAKKVYEAYGVRGVSIKVDGAIVRDKRNLALLEQDWALLGFVKRVTEQGVIYRLDRAHMV